MSVSLCDYRFPAMDLIPNLPDDLARECLIRVSYKQIAAIASVCKGWRLEIELPEFLRRRKATGHSQRLVAMTQARVDPDRNLGLKHFSPPAFRVTLLEPDTGDWCELPPVPGFPEALPIFCGLAAVGLDLVVMGGLDPVTWETSSSVFIFNFASAKWRRGADMPGVRRAFFGCASDSDRMVYVAGGHDVDKNALQSAMAYDVAEDKWVMLPDMAIQRDECKAVFQQGKFHVIGGYCTDTQGRFERSTESFDITTWQWDPMQEDFLPSNTCPRTCSIGASWDLYMCCGNDVLTLANEKWQSLATLPVDVSSADYIECWEGKLLVIGCTRYGEPHMCYQLDLKSLKWMKMENPEKFSGHVQSGCCLDI